MHWLACLVERLLLLQSYSSKAVDEFLQVVVVGFDGALSLLEAVQSMLQDFALREGGRDTKGCGEGSKRG